MKKGLCPLCRLLLFFLFRIILLFLLIRLLNQIRNIDCKDWNIIIPKAASSTESTLPVVVIAIIFDPTVVTIHKCPPQSVSIIRDQRIHFMFKDKEGKAGEIDRCQQHRQIGDEQAGSPVVGEQPTTMANAYPPLSKGIKRSR